MDRVNEQEPDNENHDNVRKPPKDGPHIENVCSGHGDHKETKESHADSPGKQVYLRCLCHGRHHGQTHEHSSHGKDPCQNQGCSQVIGKKEHVPELALAVAILQGPQSIVTSCEANGSTGKVATIKGTGTRKGQRNQRNSERDCVCCEAFGETCFLGFRSDTRSTKRARGVRWHLL